MDIDFRNLFFDYAVLYLYKIVRYKLNIYVKEQMIHCDT